MTDRAQIETLLRTRTRFRHLQHVASCPSTQELATAAPRDAHGRFQDAVFWADHQTRGRGRQQREWHDEPAADLAVTFRVHAALPTPLALAAAVPVAVALACEPLAGTALRFKWPNDVFLHGRKLSGVLIDAGVLGELDRLVPLAPLHQPNNLAPIRLAMEIDPTVPQALRTTRIPVYVSDTTIQYLEDAAWVENPGVLFGPSTAINLLYGLRLLAGLAMLDASVRWLRAVRRATHPHLN